MDYKTATNRQTGEKAVLIGDQWRVYTQSATDKSGKKAYLVEGQWLVDGAPPTPAPARSTPTPGTSAPPPGPTVPEWARQYPRLYGVAGAARTALGPVVEGVAGALGGVAGFATGGPAGSAVGAGLGYMAGNSVTKAADVALGNVAPETPTEAIVRGAEDVVIGTATEAGAQKLVKVLGPAVAAVAGKVVDRPNAAAVRAGKIAREAVGPDVNRAIEVLRQADPSYTASQALATDMNVPAFQALGSRVAARDPLFYGGGDMTPPQVAQSRNALVQMAGGGNQTAIRASQDTARDALNEVMIPMRDIELNAANTAGQMLPRLQGTANRMAGAAANKVDDVRRMVPASERLASMPDQLRVGSKVYPDVYPTNQPAMKQLAAKAAEVSDQAANASLRFGEAARFAQYAADSIKAHGLKPLTTESVVAALNKTVGDPKFAGNRDVEAVIGRVAGDIKRWTDEGGVIDAFALDAIRKNSVNAAIRDLYPGATAKVQKEVAAKVLTAVRPAITEAIEQAGGTGYKAYLNAYAAGRQAVDQGKLAGEALQMFENNPAEFVKLVRGNKPDAVEDVFGPGSYNIAKEMSQAAMGTLRGIADVAERSIAAGKQASEGQEALRMILQNNSSKFRIPWGISVKGAAVNKALQVSEERLGAKTMSTLTEGMKSGKSAVELLETLPAAERVKVLRILRESKDVLPRGVTAPAINNMAEDEPPRNSMAR
jgi:hypothetical protein